jgi:hypothetical protein
MDTMTRGAQQIENKDYGAYKARTSEGESRVLVSRSSISKGQVFRTKWQNEGG